MRTSKVFSILALAAMLIGPGCRRQPTQADLENRRLLDAIITALSMGNEQWLTDDEQVLQTRHDEGHLTDDEFTRLEAIIARARRGEAGALDAAYAFRKERPFAKPGR